MRPAGNSGPLAPPALLYRPLAGAADLDSLARLHGECFEQPWSRDTLARLVGSPGLFGLIAEAARAAAGFVLCRHAGGEAEILSLGVGGGYRRQGVGSGLLRKALHQARAGGAAAVFLEVAEDNLAALTLYLGLGFGAVGRRDNYYRRGESAKAALVLRYGLNTDAVALVPDGGPDREIS